MKLYYHSFYAILILITNSYIFAMKPYPIESNSNLNRLPLLKLSKPSVNKSNCSSLKSVDKKLNIYSPKNQRSCDVFLDNLMLSNKIVKPKIKKMNIQNFQSGYLIMKFQKITFLKNRFFKRINFKKIL